MLATNRESLRRALRIAGFAAGLAIVAYIVWLSTSGMRESQQREEFNLSVKKAIPLIARMKTGDIPSDDEIKAARIGVFEPVLVRQIRMRRDGERLLADYDAKWDQLAIDDMLNPERLISAADRASSREKLMAAAKWNHDFEVAFTSFSEQGWTEINALMQAAHASDSYVAVLAEQRVRQSQYRLGVAAIRQEYEDHVHQLLTVLDLHPKSFRLQRGPQPFLEFQDETVKLRVDAKLDDIDDLLRRADALDQANNAAQQRHEEGFKAEQKRAGGK